MDVLGRIVKFVAIAFMVSLTLGSAFCTWNAAGFPGRPDLYPTVDLVVVAFFAALTLLFAGLTAALFFTDPFADRI